MLFSRVRVGFISLILLHPHSLFLYFPFPFSPPPPTPFFSPPQQERVDSITKMDPAKACPFVGEVLGRLRAEVGNEATVLGFVGLPFTLATYLVEGKSSQEYLEIKKLAHNDPKVTQLSSCIRHMALCASFWLHFGVSFWVEKAYTGKVQGKETRWFQGTLQVVYY